MKEIILLLTRIRWIHRLILQKLRYTSHVGFDPAGCVMIECFCVTAISTYLRLKEKSEEYISLDPAGCATIPCFFVTSKSNKTQG